MSLHIERRGDGPPVVFTHGFATSGDTWAAQVEALAATHTVVTWDLRGHGRSGPPDGDYTREAVLTDLADVVAAAGRPAVLVGHSVGGYLCLAHTLAQPDTVAGLALLSTGPGFRHPERRAAYNRAVEKVAERSGYPRSVAEVAIQHDSVVIDGLPAITCPVVAIAGADDLDVYRAGARYLAEHVPGAVLIPGAGHDPHHDRPAEVSAALAELCDRTR